MVSDLFQLRDRLKAQRYWGPRWIGFLMKPISPTFAGLCPAANISASKRLSTKTGKGNRGPRQALIEAANAAARGP